jgi:hypothetical protein
MSTLTKNQVQLYIDVIEGDLKKINSMLDNKGLNIDPLVEPIIIPSDIDIDPSIRDHLMNALKYSISELLIQQAEKDGFNSQLIGTLKRISRLSSNPRNKVEMIVRQQKNYIPILYNKIYPLIDDINTITGPITINIMCNKLLTPKKFYLFGDIHILFDNIFGTCAPDSKVGYLPQVLKHMFLNNKNDVIDIFMEYPITGSKEVTTLRSLEMSPSGLFNNIYSEFKNCIVNLTAEQRKKCKDEFKSTRFHVVDTRNIFKQIKTEILLKQISDMNIALTDISMSEADRNKINEGLERLSNLLQTIRPLDKMIEDYKIKMDSDLEKYNKDSIKFKMNKALLSKEYIQLCFKKIITDSRSTTKIIKQLLEDSILSEEQLLDDPSFIMDKIYNFVIRSNAKINKNIEMMNENIRNKLLHYVKFECDRVFGIYRNIILINSIINDVDNKPSDEFELTLLFDTTMSNFRTELGVIFMDEYLLARVFRRYESKIKYEHDIIGPTTMTNIVIAGDRHIYNYKYFLRKNGYELTFSKQGTYEPTRICHTVTPQFYNIKNYDTSYDIKKYINMILSKKLLNIKETKEDIHNALIKHISSLDVLDISKKDLTDHNLINFLLELIITNNKNKIHVINISRSKVNETLLILIFNFVRHYHILKINMSSITYDFNSITMERWLSYILQYCPNLYDLNMSNCNINHRTFANILKAYIIRGGINITNLDMSNNNIDMIPHALVWYANMLSKINADKKITVNLSNNKINVFNDAQLNLLKPYNITINLDNQMLDGGAMYTNYINIKKYD